jgi:predicted dehydrogenase
MTMHSLTVGLVGAGLIAREQHLPAWARLPEVKVVGVADPWAGALAAVQNEFQIDRRVADYRELLDDPTIDIIDVCVPSALHAEVTIAALHAGKHVLCQKPMATSRADAAAMLDAARASGKKLMIGQHMRFEPSVVRLRSYLKRHPPGEIYYGRGQWLRRRRLPGRPGFTDKAQSGGGALYDLGVHMLDLAWWLMGCPLPTGVSGKVFHHLGRRTDIGSEWGHWDPTAIEVEDFGAGMLRFDNGAALSLEVSWLGLQPESEFNRLQLYGTQAGIIWPDNVIVGEEDLIPWDLRLGEAVGEKGQKLLIHAFARAVIEDQPVPIPPAESANIIAMLESLYRSSASGREEAVDAFSLG